MVSVRLLDVAEPDEFLTVAEIAERLKVNQQTVRNWMDRGELVAVRAGNRRVRVRLRDLDAFLNAFDAGRAQSARGFSAALTTAQGARDDSELVVALRALAEAASGLALVLEKPGRTRSCRRLRRPIQIRARFGFSADELLYRALACIVGLLHCNAGQNMLRTECYVWEREACDDAV